MLVLSFAIMSPDASEFGFPGEGENFFAAPQFPFVFPEGEMFAHGEFMAFPSEVDGHFVAVTGLSGELGPRPIPVLSTASNGATVVHAPILCSFPEAGFYGVLLFPGSDGEQIAHSIVEIRSV